jgi:DNA-binding beta-propeller fold protein YncE
MEKDTQHNDLKKRRKRLIRIAEIVLSILLLILIALLFYYYQLILQKGEGIAERAEKDLGPLTFKLAIYGTGGRQLPFFRRPNAVALNGNRIFVTDTGNNRVCVFNYEGRFLFSFGQAGVAYPSTGWKVTWRPGRFNYPYGIDVSPEGQIYVADTLNCRIQVFDSQGRPLFWFPKIEDGHVAEVYPMDLDVVDGRVYVADGYGDRIAVFDLQGNYFFSLGEKGNLAGMIKNPLGVAANREGTVFVSDKLNLTLAAYRSSGELIWARGRPVGNLWGENRLLGLPAGVAVDKKGYIYLVDAFNFDIKIFNEKGDFLTAVGKRGLREGEFNFPRGVKVFNDKLAVADMENNRVQIFKINWDYLRNLEKSKE